MERCSVRAKREQQQFNMNKKSTAEAKIQSNDQSGGVVAENIYAKNVAGHDIIQHITNILHGGREEQFKQKNRQIMLNRVKERWIKGFLEKTLHNEILIQLKKREEPSMVQNPWTVQVIEGLPDERRVTSSTKPIFDIFEELGGALLNFR